MVILDVAACVMMLIVSEVVTGVSLDLWSAGVTVEWIWKVAALLCNSGTHLHGSSFFHAL